MNKSPEFPEFKSVELRDGTLLRDIIWRFQPQTFEWPFTNLFIWDHHYGFQWSLLGDHLLVICSAGREESMPFNHRTYPEARFQPRIAGVAARTKGSCSCSHRKM